MSVNDTKSKKNTFTKKEEKTHQGESNLNFYQCQNVYFMPQFCMCTKTMLNASFIMHLN